MNKSILVRSMFAKAGIATASVESITAPITGTAVALRELQSKCYDKSTDLINKADALMREARDSSAEGDRAGRIAQQIEQVVL